MAVRGGTSLPPAGARRALAVALCVSMLASGFPFSPAAAAPAPQFSSENIGGRTWVGDFQVTNNAVDDDEPQVSPGADGSIRFLWRQETGGNGSFMFARLSAMGQPLQNETFITSNVSASYPVGSPHGDWAAVDSQYQIHVVSEKDAWNISYEQFDRNGSTTVGPRQIGSPDFEISEHPVVAVHNDDSVHIASSDYKFQCEDVFYAKLANNGSDLWNTRVVSSDVASQTSDPIVRAAPFSGNVLFTFGSNTGSWIGRMDRFGVKNMPSIKFRNATDGKPADVTESPDGSMHLVWEDGGNLYYSMVNVTGTKIVDARLLEGNGTVGAFPRVAAASGGSIMVAWEDNRSGSSQVMIGEIPRGGNLSAWASYTVTSSTGAAFDPVVAFDPNDQPIVAWTDTRDGDREIFFKRAAGCAMELYADPIELADMSFLHPNETRVLPFYLKNKGLLADSFLIDLTYTPGADALGWSVSIDRTHADDLAAGDLVPLNLTVHVPATAKQGDNIAVGLNATSATWPQCFDRVDLNLFVQVTRALSLNVSAPQTAKNGETVIFNLTAKNSGDLPEPAVVVSETGIPQGWNVSFSGTSFSLDPKESVNLTAWVTVPTDTGLAPANMVGVTSVTIRSSNDTTVAATRGLQVSVLPEFKIDLAVADPEREVRNGECTDFNITVSNIGNLAGQSQINLAVESNAGGWTAVLDRETVFLRGGESTNIHATACVPLNAAPDAAFVQVVNATALRFGVSENISVTVRTPPLCRGGVSAIATEPPAGGGPAVGEYHLANTGAFAQTYNISFADLPAGWTGRALVNGSAATQVVVPPNTTATILAEISPAAQALAGTVPVTVRFTSSECGVYEDAMSVAVAGSIDLSLEGVVVNASGPPGGTAEYEVRVQNAGNAATGVGLSLVEGSSGFGTQWSFDTSDGTSGGPPNLATSFHLLAFSTQTLRLHVRVPSDIPTQEQGVILSVIGDAGGATTLLLRFTVALPDLVASTLTVMPYALVANRSANISVLVSNGGPMASIGGAARFLVDGAAVGNKTLGPIVANGSVTLVFAWLPTVGNHTLTVKLEIGPGERELSTANNQAALDVVVAAPAAGAGEEPRQQQPPQPVVNDGAFSPLVAGGIIAAAAVAVALFALSRRRRPPNP